MEPTLENILRENYVDGVFHTHVSMIQPRGKYQFNRQSLEEFWKCYCDTLQRNNNPMVGVAEKPQQYLPILVDVDLKVNTELISLESDKLYTYDQVKQLVQIYQSILKKITDECEENDLVCVLLEKPPYKVNNAIMKNGFHLHFPNLFLDKVVQDVHLIPRVKEALKENKLFANLGFENSGDVIDKSCCSVPWLLYGSKKEEGANSYKLSKIYDSQCEEITIEEAFEHYQIFDKSERMINISGRIEYYLPRILSIVPYGRLTKEAKSGLSLPSAKKDTKEKNLKKYEAISNEAGVKIAESLLPLLGTHRAEDYGEWMTVGWALYNISDGSEAGLNLWLRFSQRSADKFDEAKCIYEWERMTKTDMTIGTLKYFASIDSPGKYEEFKKKERDTYLDRSISGSHNDIARVLHAEYGNKYVCASISNKLWYQFNGTRWEMMEDGHELREKISSVVVGFFIDMKHELVDKQKTAEKEMAQLIELQMKAIGKIIIALKTAPFKDNVMKECREVFFDKRFLHKLDTNPNLICFKNGVFDAKNFIFRSGRPEDFISKSMPINYVEFKPDDEKVIEVEKFLEKIFPDSSVRHYFKDVESEVFVGGNHRKIVKVWTGEGDNGKSITQMIKDQMLGEYSIKAPTTLITSKKPMNGSAWPELVRAGGSVRDITLEEPDENEEINIGIMKHLSGNDTITCRDLFQKGKDMREIKPMFKITLICNKLPNIRNSDRATWNRIRVIPFESTFCREDDPAPESYEEQLRQKRFPMDRDFAKKIPDLVEAFCWVLINHSKNGTKLKIDPEKVRSATLNYRKRNDVYRQFIEEEIKETGKDGDKISLNELYQGLRDWFRNSMPNHTIPVKNDIKEYFTKIWGELINNKWSGFRKRTDQDDIDEGRVIIVGGEDDEDMIEEEDDE